MIGVIYSRITCFVLLTNRQQLKITIRPVIRIKAKKNLYFIFHYFIVQDLHYNVFFSAPLYTQLLFSVMFASHVKLY